VHRGKRRAKKDLPISISTLPRRKTPTQDFVVPKSIPIAFGILMLLVWLYVESKK